MLPYNQKNYLLWFKKKVITIFWQNLKILDIVLSCCCKVLSHYGSKGWLYLFKNTLKMSLFRQKNRWRSDRKTNKILGVSMQFSFWKVKQMMCKSHLKGFLLEWLRFVWFLKCNLQALQNCIRPCIAMGLFSFSGKHTSILWVLWLYSSTSPFIFGYQKFW